MSTQQSIDTAPKDGTPVLTEDGIMCYLDQRRWGSPVPHGKWVHCDSDGDPYRCADEGHWVGTPQFWMELPTFLSQSELESAAIIRRTQESDNG